MKRTGTAVWNGSGKEGSGNLSTQSKSFVDQPYSWHTRFGDKTGTNPEELIASAHAGCFSMKLSFVLGAAGFTPEKIETTCTINLDNGVIDNSHLVVRAKITGITAEKFQECAQEAKANCPVSKVLNTNITMDAALL
ncbi:MAG: OsmC family protein [Bacteroidia bacterium]|nr:OsmC family protein [Bacteroidia bacterium]MCZ2276868.1 OsmC family protein [Bacteroidia bacterium]